METRLEPDTTREWTHEEAIRVSHLLGIRPLTERHWLAISLCRELSATWGTPPSVGQIESAGRFEPGELQRLFAGAPSHALLLIAGVAGKPKQESKKE